MPGPGSFDQKVYRALRRPEFFPDEFRSWMPKYLGVLSTLRISKAQIDGVSGEVWNEVDASEFQNGFANYGAPYALASYYKDFVGVVHLQGLVKNTTSQSGTKLIFTLPAGYRPSGTLLLAADGQYAGADVHCRIDLAANGDVQLVYPAASTVGYLSLSNIHFRAL